MLQDMSCFYGGFQSLLGTFSCALAHNGASFYVGIRYEVHPSLLFGKYAASTKEAGRDHFISTSLSLTFTVFILHAFAVVSYNCQVIKCRLLLLLFTWLMLVTPAGHLKKETLGWYSGLKCFPRIQVYSEPQNVIRQ